MIQKCVTDRRVCISLVSPFQMFLKMAAFEMVHKEISSSAKQFEISSSAKQFTNLEPEIEIKAQMRYFCHISAEQMKTTRPFYCSTQCTICICCISQTVFVHLYHSAQCTTVAGSSSSCEEINNRWWEGGRHRWLTNGSEYFNPLPPSDQLILWLTAGFGGGLKTGGARGDEEGGPTDH